MVQTRSQSTNATEPDARQVPPSASNSDESDGENANHQLRQIAKAKVTHKATNRAELSFNVGDEITDVNQVGLTLWEGVNKATGKKGVFNKDQVNFLLETKEGKQPARTREESELLTRTHQQNFPAHPQVVLDSIKLPVKNQTTTTNHNDWKPTYVFVMILAVVAAIVFAALSPYGQQANTSGKLRVNISDLKIQFSSQEPDMWDSLRAGLMSSRTEGVQTFLFLHNSPRTAVCLIKKLSDNLCVSYKATDISNSETFVSEVKTKLLAHKCLIMFDLEDLHPDGVAVLKGFCDAYQPIVPGSKFFFALNAGAQLETEAKLLAKNLLESKWSKDFTHDDFGGTLTRLTQNVLKIRNEPNVPC